MKTNPEFACLKYTQKTTLIGQKWNSLSEVEQDIWKQKALRLRAGSLEEGPTGGKEVAQSSDSDTHKRLKLTPEHSYILALNAA